MDKIVSTVNYEGVIFVFTERGNVYEMAKDFNGKIVFRFVYAFDYSSFYIEAHDAMFNKS